MRELLIRTISGVVLLAVIIACVLVSPWTCAVLDLFIVVVGTFEMGRLQQMDTKRLIMGEILAVGAYVIAALAGLGVLPVKLLVTELLFVMLPFLIALFSKTRDFKPIAAFSFGSMSYLSLPCAMMVFMYQEPFFGSLAGMRLIFLVFALIWVNDIFAYLTGRLLGKHKLCERISPGKTIEGSLGGLVFTLLGVIVFSCFVDWLPMGVAIGMGIIAVVFGTLGDLCESMMKRQAGVKDSGTLIPGHGGILDRFDSIMFAIPFVFVFLLLI